MRISLAFCGTALLAVSLGLALSTTGAKPGHAAASSALVSKGKALIASQHCSGCHNADLKGKPHFSPSLLPSGPVRHYNQATFVRLLTKGLDEKGKAVGPPMSNACHQTAADSKAMYAYLKTLK